MSQTNQVKSILDLLENGVTDDLDIVLTKNSDEETASRGAPINIRVKPASVQVWLKTQHDCTVGMVLEIQDIDGTDQLVAQTYLPDQQEPITTVLGVLEELMRRT